ncbi:intein/RHS repeat-associated protein [Modestobacter roseus]|uniref:Intein/RHS repeat-associated protein n=1 Tax=Modestobacter roseus TaxID=1181884 RepID=A0A562IMB2_9ACTN|nr:intein/RHS repeat-associated protein [Modestobacter roseus]
MAGGVLVPGQSAWATPVAPAGDEAAAPVAERGPDGLQAPDTATALTIARLEDERVEVIGERTETSSTWALPDGTLTTGQAIAPIWIRQGDGDGTASADWLSVDLTLQRDEDGLVRPKAHPVDLVLAGGSSSGDQALVTVDGPAGESVALLWGGELPEPRLQGPRAIYEDVEPGVDMVIDATRTGYEQFFVLTDRPSDDETLELSLTLAAEGITPATTADGGVSFTAQDGDVVASTGTPLVWDASVDRQRQHPVGESWSNEGQSASSLAPVPDWGTGGSVGGGPPTDSPSTSQAATSTEMVPPATEVLPLPQPSDPGPGEETGRAESALVGGVGGSPALPLHESATVTPDGDVDLALTPDVAFLQDPETEYPVVVDPDYRWEWGFDTWVQRGFTTDQSATDELRLGTYDGGYTVARSFINLDLSGIKNRLILNAGLFLWNWHSSTCQPRNWEVWATDLATTATRIDAQPYWGGRWSTSSQTTGYANGGCGEGWVSADVKNLIQAWSNGGAELVTMGLKAENESDNLAWKKFNSADAGWNVPTIYIQWNTPPAPATNLQTVPMVNNHGLWTASLTPELSAQVHDADGVASMQFQLYRSGGSLLWTKDAVNVPDNGIGKVQVPPGLLTDGGQYTFIVHSYDGVQWNTAASVWYEFKVDVTAPGAPEVSSADFPNDGTWNRGAGQTGSFTIGLKTPDKTNVGFEWGLDQAPTAGVVSLGTLTLPVTPSTNGRHILQVRSIDGAGNRSDIVKYAFNVGRAGLLTPDGGAQVVRRVRLEVGAQPELAYVQYRWRRGPDASNPQPIDLSTLTRSDGSPVTTVWTPRPESGGYLTWDAGATLGQVSGPVQVQAVLAENASGSGAYETAWATVTVSPDAQNAATDSVGPGTVNLLTGDYTLQATDVDEFGLVLGRTASSRNPRSGFEPQGEILTAAQQKMSDVGGFRGGNASVSRATGRGHSPSGPLATASPDSLRIAAAGGSSDSFAIPFPDPALPKGNTYRITGWIYVPSTTGLNPDHPGWGQRLLAYYVDAAGVTQVAVSDKPTRTDSWQQLSLDVTVPVAARSGALLRLYNGSQTAGKEVFFDDLSVRQIWAPLGPQWSLGTADEVAGTAYTRISQPYPDVAALHLSGGGEIWFTASGDGRWWPEPGAEALTLTAPSPGAWRVQEVDGTVSDFVRGSGETDFKLRSTSPPAGTGQSRLVYDTTANGRLRLSRLIAAVEPGVDSSPTNTAACTGLPDELPPSAGCEVMQLVYASGTTATTNAFGDYADRLVKVVLWSTLPGAVSSSSVVALRYGFDDKGRLREAWDPRISPVLKTTYDYDADGRVVELGVPGELPWRFRYGVGGANSIVGNGDLLDRSSGRLLSVSRSSLQPGTLDQVGPETTSTVVYAVPTARSTGGPYDLDTAALATWAQTRGPTDATAIFGPEDVPSVTTASVRAPGKDGYRAATVHYLDASGREVNTATPSGPGAPPAGFIDTAEYDRHGNVVRSLDATNRLLALGLLPSSASDLAALNLTSADSATRAIALSSLSTYDPGGLDLVRTRGPLLRLAIGNNPNDVRLVHDLTTYAYDEGKPDGAAYHLATTETEGLLVAGAVPEQLVDVVVTKNVYDPIDGAPAREETSGWVHKQPTQVIVDAGAGGANVTAKVRYDAQGRPVESRRAGSTGTDAGTTLTVYYSAAVNAQFPECGGQPGTAGLACRTYSAGPATGHDVGRMAAQLPVKTVTYNRYGSITSVTESATGPVGGATVTQSRTTTTEYDAADRVLSVQITGTGMNTPALGKTVSTYDPVSGDVIRMATTKPDGSVSKVEKTFDQLGRMTRYVDASGGVTDSVFDRFGKPTKVSDSIGTSTTFTYDRSIEPRGFVTSVQDSVAGTLSAVYGPDGQVMSQSLPGGVRLDVGYDANQSPVTRTYTRASDDAVVATSSVVENGAGQWISSTTSASTKNYAYDRLGRLTDVQDTTLGAGVCTARKYDYDERAQRTSLRTAVSPTAACADPTSPDAAVVSYAYDSADRLVSESLNGGAWVYDPLGRITGAPVRGSPGARVANTFYANDLVASQTIEGVARQTWVLDPLQRFSSYTSESWAAGADGVPAWQQAVTKVNHYDSDSDSPAWIAEDASLPDEITRFVDGLDGNLAVQTGKSGARVLQLVDLHGDVMTTVPIRDGEATADWAGLKHQAADEFGNTTDLTTGAAVESNGAAPGKDGRYGWLGGKQRSADALAGVLLMGVRLYDPGTGRFWSVDPSPGGNATAYDYCTADPVNCTDLDGNWGFGWAKKALKKVAAVAEVASMIPGPIGAAAAGISAGAYAATGNRAKALMMGITVAAAMIPGGGAMVKVGMAAAKSAGKVSARAGRAVVKAFKGGGSCRVPNSFTPETGVLMADGATVPIGQVQVGDLVAARDPETGELTAQPVLDVIVGHGDKHLIKVVTAPAPASALAEGQVADDDPRADTWTATANHPIWVDDEGWTEADDLALGDLLMGAAGEYRVVQDLDDRGWLPGQVVYNLSVANVHTFVIGAIGDGSLVHNCSAPGFRSQQANMRALINNDKVSRTIRGELANLAKQKKRLRVDGMQMAHRRTHEAAKGCGYQCSVLQTRGNHMRQHRIDDWGRAYKNKPFMRR